MKNFAKGYTLLELLVVIGIIVILIGLGTVSFSTAQKKARDAKRRGDMRAIQTAFEQAYTLNNFTYPAYSNGAAVSAWPGGYISVPFTFPTDPLGGSYICVSGTNCTATAFTICPPQVGSTGQRLEGETTCPVIGVGSNSCCVTNQQ